MKNFKRDFVFALWMLPVTVIATVLSFFYQLDLLGEQMELMAQQVGGIVMLGVLGTVQSCMMLFVACLFGHHVSEKLGLWRTVRWEKEPLRRTILVGVAFGVVALGDHFLLGGMYPEIRQANLVGNTPIGVATAVVYGGIVEELLMRLFVMSVLSWVLWKLFARKEAAAPAGTLLAGNLLAAILFAAGHLPVTAALFGGLDALIVLRCFVLNGIPGFCFGRLYAKYGLHYAILSHMLCHLCFKVMLLFL